MVRKYTLLEKIVCVWLKWHWLDKGGWTYHGQRHSVCKLCGGIVSKRK